MTRDIRAQALLKIASLSAGSSSPADRSDLDRLCRACHATGKARDYSHSGKTATSLGKVPMSIREFEVLLALCKTAPNIQNAQILSSPYADPDDVQLDEAIRTVTIVVALLGFMDAASAQADFWRSNGRLALVQKVRHILSERFLVAVNAALSTIRNSHSHEREVREWRRLIRHYSHLDRPLGAMLLQRSFMSLLATSTSLLVANTAELQYTHILDVLMSRGSKIFQEFPPNTEDDLASVEVFAAFTIEQMAHLENNEDYLRMSSPSEQRLAYASKAAALVSFLNCSLLNEEVADVDTLLAWLQESLGEPEQVDDHLLASVVVRSLAIICHISPSFTPTISRLLPKFLVQSAPPSETVAVASKSLAYVLKSLSKDAVISTLYSLGNILSPEAEASLSNGQINGTAGGDANLGPMYANRQSVGSTISFAGFGEDGSIMAYENVVHAICCIAETCQDDKITALAQSMLVQKYNKVNPGADVHIMSGAAILALNGGQLEFKSLLKWYTRTCHESIAENKEYLKAAVLKARTYISANVSRNSPLFDIYWEHLLETIISFGDAGYHGHTKEADVQLAAEEIAEMLPPVAVFMSRNDFAAEPVENDETAQMLRDAWFNIVVHGFTTASAMGNFYIEDLRTIAVHSPPLVAEKRSEQLESDIELNTVLRRGNSSEREAAQKKQLCELIPAKAGDIRGLSYRKVIFLQSAYLVESLRTDVGDCTKVLSYFLEPSMRKGDVSSAMEGIASTVVDRFVRKTLNGTDPLFSAQYAAKQLMEIFRGCCHRIERVQQAALLCADRIIHDIPSALCSRTSLFALLELLSLMWTSCLEAETDLYAPRAVFRSQLGGVTVELSDNYEFRRRTLDTLNKKAKIWVNTAINLAPLDVKGLLQTYLSEFSDDGAYGHVSLGRSFALELGSVIPSTDQRLQSLGRVGDCDINTASDLIAQYTTRQEYRYGETLPDRGNELMSFMTHGLRQSIRPPTLAESANASTALAHVEARILSKKTTSLNEIRDILRRAAALLCRSHVDESAVARYLVSIPFSLFTKQSMKLGVSLWLGVINENPRLESKLVNEIAQQWEFSITRRVGLFNPVLSHPDPFFLKEEFAPSELEALAKRKQLVHDMLSPHARLLQFFASHFNATRLGSIDTRRSLLRMLNLTLVALTDAAPHPMARELRFLVILFGLRVLRASPMIGTEAQWRLKDKILLAGLSWFKHSPKWSFGSNLLQLRTEVRLITDVLAALKVVSFIGANHVGSSESLQRKEQLFQLLLENEQTRLCVWISPLSASAFHMPHHSHKSAAESALASQVRTAWGLDPAIAIELATRYHSPRIHKEIRSLLLANPERAVDLPEAIPLIFNGGLPSDAAPALKYMLYWEPVNPITAVSMFTPGYKDHPFLVQYAMRALESHDVGVTFFYVPQIVQTLRYDRMGYAERYILETAQFSQLFAHQIIWNMKANSYKDDDAQVPDEIKTDLDRVMGKMVDSFTPSDRTFYEREFAFFDEVTDISGKLKPIRERPKDEKKQKIEEELRKIQMDVGVYLPSNPEGVVIGIDRKSGKPLQSHAKCPFMATFRIKKPKNGVEETNNMLADINDAPQESVENGLPAETTIEAWQSAIFKVGDDCRQDVLALQMISAFRGIFHNVGLDVWVFPYRVTATGPGCGVIDVLPNSISRDMLGREAVNKLYDYFVSKYGNEDSLRFQQARNNFVKSMAAYSVISFLLQFKDRHNGNIMIDDGGHIIHIDFGFCFDIAPGGIKFERAPFKLTQEMLAVMGGSTDHQSFKWFEELCVKAFLASRQHCEKLCQMVSLMIDSGLPCFKPESLKNFRDRFVLEKSEREAADFMRDLIKKSASSYSTGVYDQFQLLTNGIPY
ncbi:Phosphatidylinositol 4-kinase-like protein [Emericellopsis cladophorae]|uniref:1-phosphatidylinositol 4-kinase n=1 Tax=Emericellopsis cladophorae TaxID=2686198 RepID=A0A9P9Y9H5_9HYPO|nr:Phosphatidylinositol 4-kinase-like protein [Emericellopsis cladophorae]KAI6785997.1 Phosphatidylinositol 4-kinase-like protein [Emericellopsis cladophorae]